MRFARKTSWFILGTALLVLLCTRLYALYKVGALFYEWEGLHTGCIAKELLDGAGWLSILDNPKIAAGGYSITGYIVALFFSIFGDSFLSLALVLVLFSLLILAVFYFLLEKHFGRPAAVLFSVLFIFMPLGLFRYSMIAHGFHFQAALFSVLGLCCFFEIFFNEARCKTYLENMPERGLALLFMAFGFVSGFGVYFCYDYLIMLSALMFFWLIIDKKLIFKRYFYIFCAGCVTGFIPWLVYNMRHAFAGLRIKGATLLECVCAKNLTQVLHTSWLLVTNSLHAEGLGKILCFLVLLSFILLIVSNHDSMKRLWFPRPESVKYMKELIFIGYVLMLIATLSVVYLPVAVNVATPADLLSSGLRVKLYHLYPFLFVIVALCFNKLWPLKSTSHYRLRIILALIAAGGIVCMGFFNYARLLSFYGNSINPRKIKGYTFRRFLSGSERQELGVDFIGRDTYRISRAKGIDMLLWKVFTTNPHCYTLYTGPHLDIREHSIELTSYPAIDEPEKIYYYILEGLNTGDFMESYNIAQLNSLMTRKIASRYRHYVYEGVAVSVMNRRYKEILTRLDFINTVPEKYRHYFLLELGRVIGRYFDIKTGTEVLDSVAGKFTLASKAYLYRGFMGYSVESKRADRRKKEFVKQRYPSYFYRAKARRGQLRDIPSREDMPTWLGKVDGNERYSYQGMIEGLFTGENVYEEKDIKNKIQAVIACDWVEKGALCEGLGLGLGHFTFGYIKKFVGFMEPALRRKELARFYYGYCLSLKERYGLDVRKMKELVDSNVDTRFKWLCYKIIWSPKANADIL